VSHPPITVKLSGPYACFTRPEMHTERVTYEVPTPSAMRGALEAIFFKPQMRWRIREIQVLKPIKHASIMRNEVNLKASPQNDGIDIISERTQRHAMVLRDVAYIVKADVYVPGSDADAEAVKHRDQFRRRVRRGACFHRPYFGCREFAVDFSDPDGTETPIDYSADLGLMLFDIDYGPALNVPRFFEAKIERGVIRIDPSLYERSTP